MGTANPDGSEDFRLDRTQFSVVHPADSDDGVQYWLSRPVEERLRALEILKSLNSNGVEYLLIGGYAVGICGRIRATNDLDVWVDISPENATRIDRALRTSNQIAARMPQVRQQERFTQFAMILASPNT